MDSFHSQQKPSKDQQNHQKKPSSSELLSSAKVVADAAKSSLHHESDKVDKGKVAGAAANLLGAASHYGKFEEKGYSKYVGKAENYLHNYHSSHSTTTTTAAGHNPDSATHSAPHQSSGGGDHGHGHGHSSGSGGGYGDYLKMAEGFLKKH